MRLLWLRLGFTCDTGDFDIKKILENTSIILGIISNDIPQPLLDLISDL
jgi:hypothetical protein